MKKPTNMIELKAYAAREWKKLSAYERRVYQDLATYTSLLRKEFNIPKPVDPEDMCHPDLKEGDEIYEVASGAIVHIDKISKDRTRIMMHFVNRGEQDTFEWSGWMFNKANLDGITHKIIKR